MKSASLLLDDAADLAGLPADDVASAAEAARTAGHEGKFLLTLIQPSNQPALAALENRDVRRRLYEASIGRGSDGSALDVLDLVKDMVRLRAEKAALLGFANYAELVVDQQTAPDFAAVQTMMNRLAPAAVRNADAEAEALAEVAGHPLEAWDWAYYSAKVKRERYAVDEQALRPYFELDRVLNDGVFFAANALYGITFHERADLAGYHPDVRVWEVRNSDGTELGLFLGDYYTRESKRGGAWMNSLVEQSGLLNTRPVVINNLNISKPPAGRTHAPDPGRAAHHLPRVRPCPARAVLRRHLSAVLRHLRAAGLRGIPLAGERNVDHVAGGPGQLRPPPRHRRGAAAGGCGQARRRAALGRGLRHHRIPGRCPAGPGLACAGRLRGPRRRPGVRGQGTGRGRRGAPA